MLAFITSKANNTVFDFLTEEQGMFVKRMSGELNLSKFLTQEIRNYAHYQFLAIDLKALKGKDSEIVDAFRSVRMVYDGRIIVYAEGLLPGNTLLKLLLEESFFNIITATGLDLIRDEIRACISDEGMKYDDSVHSAENDENVIAVPNYFTCTDIKIAIAGLMPRIGTTHNAMNLASCLASCGAKVSFTEYNDRNSLQLVAEAYNFEVLQNGHYRHQGVDYYKEGSFQSGYNFNIFDFGILTDNKIEILKKFDVRILCCGSKPYELPTLINYEESLKDVDLNLLFCFSPEIGRIKLKRFETMNHKLFYPQYASSLFDHKNRDIFKTILKEWIVENSSIYV